VEPDFPEYAIIYKSSSENPAEDLILEYQRFKRALEEIARLDQGKSAWLARRALNWEEK